MACPLRHYLGYFYWFAAIVGALAAIFGMKDARVVGGGSESAKKKKKKK